MTWDTVMLWVSAVATAVVAAVAEVRRQRGPRAAPPERELRAKKLRSYRAERKKKPAP